MNRPRKIIASALAFALATGPSSLVVAESIVKNGSFDTTSNIGSNTGNPVGVGQLGYSVNVADWTLISAAGGTSLAFVGTASDFHTGITDGYGANNYKLSTSTGGPVAASSDGGNFIAADGSPSYQAGIQQTLTGLTVGQTYAVSFDWAAAQQVGFTGATTEAWQVGFSDGTTNQVQTTSIYDLPQGQKFSGWMQQTFDFTATSTSETLSFLAVGTPNGMPPVSLLDGVSAAAVPEPGSLALMGLGALSLGLARLVRRKKKVASA